MDKIGVSKGKIIIDDNNGSHPEMNFKVPKDIADFVIETLNLWKKNWVATIEELEQYQKEVEGFEKVNLKL